MEENQVVAMTYQGFYDASRDHSKIIFGEGSLASLPAEIKMRGQRVLLITSNTVNTKTDLVEKVSGLLGSSLVGVFAETKPHSPRTVVLKAADLARSLDIDCLISLGGGSATDTIKAVALMLWMNILDGDGFDEAHKRLPEQKGENGTGRLLPQISLPTTLVGAEFTPGMGITNEEAHAKQVFSHPFLRARAVILDPQLTVYTPSVLWLSTGIKALEHAIAKLSAVDRHPVEDATATLSVQIMGRELVRSFEQPDDLAARGQLQVGAWLSMFSRGASSGMRMGLSHALGRQCGAVCEVPHGLISSVILPLSMDYNASVSGAGLTIAAQALGVNTVGLTGEEAGHAAAEATRALISRLDLPARLRDIGVSKDVLPLIAERTMNDWSIGKNPRKVTGADEVLTLLEQAW